MNVLSVTPKNAEKPRRGAHFAAVCLLSVTFIVIGRRAESVSPESAENAPLPQVTVVLNTGGSLRGAVADWNDHGLVLVSGETPYVFSWNELDTLSGYAVQRQLLFTTRNGLPLNADQHFRLGAYTLRRNKRDLASEELTSAVKLDPGMQKAVQELIETHKPRKRNMNQSFPRNEPDDDTQVTLRDRNFSAIDTALASNGQPDDMVRTPAEVRALVLEIYRRFGTEVQETIGRQIALIETEHFLIWSDWAKAENPMLGEWCEQLYAELSRQFMVTGDESVFLAKCPIFVFRSPNRFRKFARTFDGYDAAQSAGYTRSIEANGHTHVALLRFGDSQVDYDQFAWTLAHETTHAFLHRWHSTRLIPHWVNEGIAERSAQRVLGARCPAWNNAQMLARQCVKHNWPVRSMLASAGPIDTHEYPLAHSVIEYLDSLGPGKLAGFVRHLKDGRSIADALADQWEGMTVDSLDQRWRDWVRAADVAARTTG